MSQAPWRVAGYQLELPLGRGAHARVWRARVRRTGDSVAIKLVPCVGRAQRDAARTEAALLMGLDHPHLVRLHDVVSCPEGLALVLDLASGGSLAQLLAARGRLTPGEVATALAPVGAALSHAHNASVVHGDVSAANVLFTDVGLPLLADLGIARVHGDRADSPAAYTPAYVDPVVAAGGVASTASDVFMLAGVALHALTGAPPWPQSSAPEARAAAMRGDPGDVAARLRRAGVPEPMCRVICAGLSSDPGSRPSAAEFALDLRHSVSPTAVEICAGRRRRPDHDDSGEPGATDAVLTVGHRAPTPALPRPRHPAAVPGARPRRTGVAAGAVVGVAAALVAATVWWAQTHGGPTSHAATGHARVSTQVGPTASAESTPGAESTPAAGSAAGVPLVSPGSTGTRPRLDAQPAVAPSRDLDPGHAWPSRTPALLGADAVTTVLADLDQVRSRAYAQRDPALLTHVYASAQLRAQDAAQIDAIVPVGCGLSGVRTTYRNVTVTAGGLGQVAVRARTTMQPSTLTCAGTTVAHAPAGRPTSVRITLRRVGGHYLIAEIRR